MNIICQAKTLLKKRLVFATLCRCFVSGWVVTHSLALGDAFYYGNRLSAYQSLQLAKNGSVLSRITNC